MFCNEFYDRLKQIYEQAENEKVHVSDIRQVVQDEFKNVSKEETGRIIKYAFLNSQRRSNCRIPVQFSSVAKNKPGYVAMQ